MLAIKRELKLNKVETSLMRGCAGFKRFVYNFALELLTSSWQFEEIKASDVQRIDAIKKILTQMMDSPEYQWMKKYPSTVYQSAFRDLKKAFSFWRQGLSGFPKKKSKKKGDSFTVYKTSGIYPVKGQPAIAFTNRVVIEAGKKIRLPGLKTFRLKEKQAMYGTKLEIVDRWYPSSRTCSQCGHIQPMPLSARVFDCQVCDWVACRDLNASFNLERAPEHLVRLA
jgi:putative transposase